MKTKRQTKTRNQAQKVKEAIKTVLFFGVPLAVIIFVLTKGGTFNAF